MPGNVKNLKANETHQPRAQKSSTLKFTNGHEIREALRTQNQEVLLQNLAAIRNQVSLKSNEDIISPNDERLLLAQNWLENSPAAKEALELWDAAGPKQNSLVSLLLSILSSLLYLLSHHYPFQASGHALLKVLLSPQYTRRLNSYIGGSQNELILLTLKLYNSMSNFAGGREKKLVLESFGWELKSLPKLVSMRRKTKGEDNIDPIQRPDIRTLYILFLLSFVAPTTTSSIKTSFLEQHRDQFLLIFKALNQDPYTVVRRIMEVCWTGIWGDAKVKRTLKISLFNEITLGHILKLYERSAPEQDNSDYIPADLIHHFLLAICTRPGVGICFKDHGWYPRESDGETQNNADDDVTGKRRGGQGGKIYNKILSNFLKTLKVNEDARQQELALRILAACPELVAGYWPTASLTLEPRLSSKWITNIAFFGTVVSLPIPIASFSLDGSNGDSAMYKPTPPPLTTILSNFLPSSIPTKLNFTKGLQSSSGLVQHCTATALTKCLSKYESILQIFKEIEAKLEETEGEGQWSRRRQEVEREARRRVPEFQVIISFSQQKFGLDAAPPKAKGEDGESEVKQQEPNEVKAAMLSEAAHRLLWMYHRCLPALVDEARFDVGKLLVQCRFTDPHSSAAVEAGHAEEDEEDEEQEEQDDDDREMQGVEGSVREVPEDTGQRDDDEEDDSGDEEEENPDDDLDKSDQLGLLKDLHVLRLLKESDQFVWSAKAGASGTYLSTLLKAYASSRSDSPTRTILAGVLQHVLSQSIMFQEDPSEVLLWLLCLPSYHRRPGTSAPDDAPLEDEIESVVAFLDDCVQRCLKTTYKYIEELYTIGSPTPTEGKDIPMDGRPTSAKLEAYPSPLLMTVLEQLNIKVQKKLLSPSAVLALATFVRKLCFRLSQKLEEQTFLLDISRKLDMILAEENLFTEFGVMTAAIRRECRLLRAIIQQKPAVAKAPPPTSDDLHDFLGILEDMPIPVTSSGRENTAVELIDWVRLVGEELGSDEVKAVWDCLMKLDPSKTNDLVHALDPSFDVIWSAIDPEELCEHIDFDLLFIHWCHSRISRERDAQLQASFVADADVQQLKRITFLVGHHLSAALQKDPQDLLIAQLLRLSARAIEKALQQFTQEESRSLKEMIFARLPSFRSCFTLEHTKEEIIHGVRDLVEAALSPADAADQTLISALTSHWLDVVRTDLANQPNQITLASIWLSYLPVATLFGFTDTLLRDIHKGSRSATLLTPVLRILNEASSSLEVDVGIQQRLADLLSLQDIIPDSKDLDELIARGILASLPPHLDGTSLSRDPFEEAGLAGAVHGAQTQWTHRSRHTALDLPIGSLLSQGHWSKSTVAILKGLIYHRILPRQTFVDWLGTHICQAIPADSFIPVFRAFAETWQGSAIEASFPWQQQFRRLLDIAFDANNCPDLRLDAVASVGPLLRLAPSAVEDFFSILTEYFNKLRPSEFSNIHVSLGHQLLSLQHPDVGPAVAALVNSGVQWAIRTTAEQIDGTTDAVLDSLMNFVPKAKNLQASHVETLLTVVIQERMPSASTVNFVTALISHIHLKPVVVNRHLQSIIQHPDFFKLCAISTPEKATPRDAVINLLHTLFNLHPTNTCQPTHVEPLVKVYHGTLSIPDCQILSIFQLFEEERKTSISSLIGRWTSNKTSEASKPLESIQSLDPAVALRTTLNFPKWRQLHDLATGKSTSFEAQLYDPVFLLLLFAQVLAEDTPTSALTWVELFRSNIVGLVVRCLSARDPAIRELALSQLAVLWRHLESADLHEKPHVIHVLSLLRDTIPAATASESPIRLPTSTTLLLAHALRGIFYPSNFIYPITARFLLQRPELDTGDIPLLFSMLYSSSDDWKKERGWMLRFLADGMVGSDDWRVLKRRHTWDLLASMYQASPEDRPLRIGVLEVLASLTCHQQATMSLVLKSALLTWIETQMIPEKCAEAVEWIKILDNIMSVADAEKLEAATGGEWRATIARCLYRLLDSSDVLPFAVSAILRLSLLPGTPCMTYDELLAKSLRCLGQFETDIKIPAASVLVCPLSHRPCPPYPAHDIHTPFPIVDHLGLWGHLVESLWRASMSSASKSTAWDGLTSRLLVWRSLVGVEGSQLGEWARTELIENLSNKT